MRMLVLLVVALCSAVDPALQAQCQDWVSANQKDLIILNQVASGSHISTCPQYCMVAGSGFRADTSTCRSLCEKSGGYTKFAKTLAMQDGFAAPIDVCTALFKTEEEEDNVVMLEVSSTQSAKERKLGVRGDLTVQGTLSTSMLTSPIGDVKVSGGLNVMSQAEASTVRAAFLKSDTTVTIKQGIVSKKDQLLIKGKIDADSISAEGIQSSFLEIDGVTQWGLHSLEDFEEVGVDGWDHGIVTDCGGHKLLGGHCAEKKGSSLVEKTFENLPPHNQLRVNAKYMFIDSWDGESGFLKLDGNTVWVKSYNHADGEHGQGMNICGNETPEKQFGAPIDVTIPHTSSSVTLQFGATTDEHPCDESFGIDSVMVFTR